MRINLSRKKKERSNGSDSIFTDDESFQNLQELYKRFSQEMNSELESFALYSRKLIRLFL